jgi:hypothetical protein
MLWRTKWKRYVACIDELRNARCIFDGKSQIKGSFDALHTWNIQKYGLKVSVDSSMKRIISRVGGMHDF